MLRRLGVFLLIGSILGLQAGCSSGSDDMAMQADSATVEAEDSANRTSIPFKQIVYSKNASDLSWKWETIMDEGIPEDIKERYEEIKNPVPGGTIVGETGSDYYISLSIGNQNSAAEGFKVVSMWVPNKRKEEDPVLTIEVKPVSNEGFSNEYEGEVNVRSLVRISKEALPEDVSLHAISMRVSSLL